MSKPTANDWQARWLPLILVAATLIVLALASVLTSGARASDQPGADPLATQTAAGHSLHMPRIASGSAPGPATSIPAATSTAVPAATPDPTDTAAPTSAPATLTPWPTGTPGPSLPMLVLTGAQFPCNTNLAPAQAVDAPPLYSLACAVSAGHSVKAELRYYADGAELAAAFAALRGAAPLEDFHGSPAFYRQEPWNQAPGGTQQIFAWHSASWLLTLRTYDDTHFLGPIRSWAESLYQSAASRNLDGYAPGN